MKKVIGIDLGDRQHVAVVFEEDGTENKAVRTSNTKDALRKFFNKHKGAVVVMEAGTHSGWISRLLESMAHEVWVGNPRELRAIWDSTDKSDERDARVLGMMYRLEPRLLNRIFHRGEKAQCDLAVIKCSIAPSSIEFSLRKNNVGSFPQTKGIRKMEGLGAGKP